MDSLPTDILRHIITFLLRTEMTRLMLCSKQFYLHVRGALYASLDLKLTPFSLNRHINLLRILSSSGSIQARCVRHLSVHGLALTSHETQASLSQALIQAVGLLSLEISLKTRPASIAGQIFTDELCHSPEFLPQLVALKADDVEVVHALVPQRPIHSVFLEDTVPASMVTPFLNALASSTSAITQLQVRLEVHDNASVVDLAHKVASTFPKLSVLCIEVFLLQPAEKPLSWKSMKDILRGMGPALGDLYQLHTFSFTAYPEPLGTGSLDTEIDQATQLLLRSTNTLRNIELQWRLWNGTSGSQSIGSYKGLIRRRWAYKSRLSR